MFHTENGRQRKLPIVKNATQRNTTDKQHTGKVLTIGFPSRDKLQSRGRRLKNSTYTCLVNMRKYRIQNTVIQLTRSSSQQQSSINKSHITNVVYKTNTNLSNVRNGISAKMHWVRPMRTMSLIMNHFDKLTLLNLTLQDFLTLITDCTLSHC